MQSGGRQGQREEKQELRHSVQKESGERQSKTWVRKMMQMEEKELGGEKTGGPEKQTLWA